MIVVCNTSPLTNLAAIGQFHLMQQLYGNLHVAHGVWDELNAGGKHWPGRDETASVDWIEMHIVADQTLVTALRGDLDRGEAESIALAIELGADLILMDEREGRHTAQRFGLVVVGVLGILLEAKSRGFVDTVGSHLDALRWEAGFYLDDEVYQRILQLAGE